MQKVGRCPPNAAGARIAGRCYVAESAVVRGYSHRAREIATDMAADVLSLTGGGDDLAPWRKDRLHATKATSGALGVIAVRWGGPAGGCCAPGV